MNTFVILLATVVAQIDKTPADNDVKAGWGAFAVFIGLIAAVALLCWSLVRHLRKVKDNAAAGVFGEADAASGESPASKP